MAKRPQKILVPAFESEMLSSIAIAMGRRRKAMRHGGVKRFAMERDADPEGHARRTDGKSSTTATRSVFIGETGPGPLGSSSEVRLFVFLSPRLLTAALGAANVRA